MWAKRLSAAVVSVAALLLMIRISGQPSPPDNSEITSTEAISTNVQEDKAPTSPSAEFSTTELRSALTDICSLNEQHSTDENMTPEEMQAQLDTINELWANLSERLSVSASAEHLHMAALLASDSASQIELLEQAISKSPTDPSILWTAVRICSDSRTSLDCPLSDWEQHLITVDSQNSESWIRIAANHHMAGDTDAALEAMQHAATAAETRIYWPETIEMIERGLSAAGSESPFPERAAMAFGLAATTLPAYGDYTRMCVEQSSQSAEWAYACLRYGELAENQGKTDLGISIGRSMQKLAYEALGDIEKATEIQQKLERRQKERMSKDINHTLLTEKLMVSNPTMFSAFLFKVRSVGEVEAQRQIAAEVDQLLEQQPELACEL